MGRGKFAGKCIYREMFMKYFALKTSKMINVQLGVGAECVEI